jgi:hypothetical protein
MISMICDPRRADRFFSRLILLMLGVLGEHLWRMFASLNNIPEAVIDETIL